MAITVSSYYRTAAPTNYLIDVVASLPSKDESRWRCQCGVPLCMYNVFVLAVPRIYVYGLLKIWKAFTFDRIESSVKPGSYQHDTHHVLLEIYGSSRHWAYNMIRSIQDSGHVYDSYVLALLPHACTVVGPISYHQWLRIRKALRL